MKPTPIKPMGVSINRPLWSTVLQWCLTTIAVVVVTVLLAALFAEWLVGCGESYVDSKGGTHTNECLFINVNRGVSK